MEDFSHIQQTLDRIESITDEWIEDRASEFDPRSWESKDAHELRRKACSEAALYLLQADKIPGESVDSPKLKEIVIEATNGPLFYELLHREPMQVRSYGYAILYASEQDELSNEKFWEFLGDRLEQKSLRAIDRLPFETLDLWHMSKIYGRDIEVGPDEIFPLSGLPYPMDIFQVDLDDIYPFTHHLMFYRGMGMKGYDFPNEQIEYDLETELCGLTLRFLGKENYDIVLELLLSGVLHHQLPPDLVAAVLEIIRDVAEEEGKVPDYTIGDGGADTIASQVDDTLGDLGGETVEWGENYHVNLVAGYTVRGTRSEWDDLVASYSDEERPEYDRDQLLEFSRMLAAFANYNLQEGASKLESIVDEPIVDAFPQVFDDAVTFLKNQRRSDGTYGYWAKEKLKFESMGYDTDQFEPELIEPVSDSCKKALQAANKDD
jgi:hypothetical protein